jgi:hypothetical protein
VQKRSRPTDPTLASDIKKEIEAMGAPYISPAQRMMHNYYS